MSSNPPGRHAGNLDNKELVAGSTLYIPVFVPGALFEVGDGHAAQGDGEVDQTAIETSLRGGLQLTVRKDMKLSWPRAETATHFISMATDPDLKVATTAAIQEMVDFLAASKGLTKHEAYQLVSIAGDVAITQLVDRPVVGVHVKMPKSISYLQPYTFACCPTMSSRLPIVRFMSTRCNPQFAAGLAALPMSPTMSSVRGSAGLP